MQGNLLKVNAFKVADLLGAKADVKGSVTDFAAAPRYDLTFNATLPDADKVIAYAGLAKVAITGKIGRAVAERRRCRLAERALRYATSVRRCWAAPRASPEQWRWAAISVFDFPTFTLQTQEAGRRSPAATGQSAAIRRQLSAAGAFKGDAQRVCLRRQPDGLRRRPMTGHVDASRLGARPNINVNLRGARHARSR